MERTELTLVAAAALLAAMLIGWALRWIYEHLNPPVPPEPKADSEWAEYAKTCEAERDEARTRLTEVERDLGNKVAQAEAERDAAMDGLGEARRWAHELEAELESYRSDDKTA